MNIKETQAQKSKQEDTQNSKLNKSLLSYLIELDMLANQDTFT